MWGRKTRYGYSVWERGEGGARISALALSMLELLDERAMHPYELAATMRERHHDEFIRLNFGTLYHTVEVLERSGLIVSVPRETPRPPPASTIYDLTHSRRQLLANAARAILAQPTRPHPHFAARLMLTPHLTAP